ncbi:hypothetical protein [Occallatibacter savannae]|uniref:hypothetical protein n=1 Tax=Occallatibacter savannae TaxID=1002691 RepID=UPI0019514AB6|nr:hypothetical protein [Occallatibacter savannae]
MRSAHLALCALLLSPAFAAYAARQILPAGALINCTVSETRLSSGTAAVGDPVLCQASIMTRNSSARLPFNTYLEGRFEDYKDPGHFVGKGWMELKFDRMVIEPRTVLPLSARVVDAPGFKVDREGRILGKGHATRDIVLWSLPILWPIDLLMLPGRGPKPTLKAETRLTLKVMDDTEVPIVDDPDRDPSGLYRRPSAYDDAPREEPQQRFSDNQMPPPPQYQQQQQYAPPQQYQQPQYQPSQQYQQPQYAPPQQQAYAPPPQQSYVQPVYVPVMPVYAQPPQTVYVYSAPPPPAVHVYMYTQPAVSVYSPPRVTYYPNTIAAYRPFGSYGPYGYGY